MITYTHPWPDVPQLRVPVLHKVVYAQTEGGVPASYQRSYKDHLVDTWLNSTCQAPYYHSPGYLTEKSIHFECDEEAVLFALRWGT